MNLGVYNARSKFKLEKLKKSKDEKILIKITSKKVIVLHRPLNHIRKSSVPRRTIFIFIKFVLFFPMKF